MTAGASPQRPDRAAASVEKALAFLKAQGESAAGDRGARDIVGSPETVRAGLEEVAEEYGADEVLVVTLTYDHAARRRSYELIAEVFGLRAGALAPDPLLAG